MRRLGMGLLCIATACTADVAPAERITGAEFCRRANEALVGGATTCCGTMPLAADLAGFSATCASGIAPIVDDPRTGFDTALALAALDQMRAGLSACEPTMPSGDPWLDVRQLAPGTLAIGAECASTPLNTSTVQSICRGGFCALGGVGVELAHCSPYVIEGGACDAAYECAEGLFCSVPASGLNGFCARLHPLGDPCTDAEQCASRTCATGMCAAPPAMARDTLCTSPTASLRDVDVELTGFPESTTREIGVRVIDGSLAQIVLERILGVPQALATQHLPRAVPTDATGLVAQVWTMDSSDPTAEMRAWEQPIADTGPIVVMVDYGEPSTSTLSSMPPFDFDSQFDIQTFAFDLELGKTLHLRLLRTDTGRTVGEARLDAISDIGFQIVLPSTVVPGVGYQFLMYVDENGDDAYEPPPTDHAWRALATAPSSGGLSLPWMWSSDYQDVAY